jgi:hypothetical protein
VTRRAGKVRTQSESKSLGHSLKLWVGRCCCREIPFIPQILAKSGKVLPLSIVFNTLHNKTLASQVEINKALIRHQQNKGFSNETTRATTVCWFESTACRAFAGTFAVRE